MKPRFTATNVEKRASHSNTKGRKGPSINQGQDSWKEREKAYSNVYGATLLNQEKQNLKNIGEQFYVMKDAITSAKQTPASKKRKGSRIKGGKGRSNTVEVMDVFPAKQ